MTLHTFASRAAAAVVAAVAGFASYRHIYTVAADAGEHPAVAAVLPLAIDGLILVATLAMLDDKRHDRHPRMSARVALAFGVAATLAANIASAEPTVTARLVAAVPAVSFLLAVEVLARTGKPRTVTVAEPAPTEGLSTAEGVGGSDTPAEPAPAKIEPANPQVETLSNIKGFADPSDPREAAREVYRRSVAEGKPLSGAALGRMFGKSDRWGVERVHEVRAEIASANGKPTDLAGVAS